MKFLVEGEEFCFSSRAASSSAVLALCQADDSDGVVTLPLKREWLELWSQYIEKTSDEKNSCEDMNELRKLTAEQQLGIVQVRRVATPRLQFHCRVREDAMASAHSAHPEHEAPSKLWSCLSVPLL
jgi:hypothetical protein